MLDKSKYHSGLRASVSLALPLLLLMALGSESPSQTLAVPGSNFEVVTAETQEPCSDADDSNSNRIYIITDCGDSFASSEIVGFDPVTGGALSDHTITWSDGSQLTNLTFLSLGDFGYISIVAVDKNDNKILLPTEGIEVDISSGQISQMSGATGANVYSAGYDQVSQQLLGNFSKNTSEWWGSENLVSGAGTPFSVGDGGPFDYETDTFNDNLKEYVTQYYNSFSSEVPPGAGVLLINPKTGIASAIPLPPFKDKSGQECSDTMFGYQSDPTIATLYAVLAVPHDCSYMGGSFTDLQLVRIDLVTGSISEIADVFGYYTSIYGDSASVDPNNFQMSVGSSDTSIINAADISTNRSWYINGLGNESDDSLNNWMNSAGFALGQRDSSVPAIAPGGAPNYSTAILDFGAPTKGGGASGFGRSLSATEIESMTKDFADGWRSGAPTSSGALLRIVIGTSNSANGNVTEKSGASWAGIVSNVAKYISDHYAQSIVVMGGMDIESDKGFSPPDAVRTWQVGFAGTIVDYGDLGGCPTKHVSKYSGTETCNGKWHVSDFKSVIGDNPVVPQIYSSTLSKQWGLFAAYDPSVVIVAPLTQYAACLEDFNPSCDNLVNTPFIASVELQKNISTQLFPSADIEWRVY